MVGFKWDTVGFKDRYASNGSSIQEESDRENRSPNVHGIKSTTTDTSPCCYKPSPRFDGETLCSFVSD